MEMGEDDGSTIVEGSSSMGISSPRWVDHVCPGFRFNPTDEQLLVNFLRMKVSGHPLPFGMDEVIPTIPLYGPGGDGDPRTLFQRLPSYCCIPHPLVQTPVELYVFTNWEHVNSGNRPLRSCGQGTWTFNFDNDIVDSRGSLIGHISNLTYHLKNTKGGGKGPTTHWVMHEFHLPDPPQSSQLPEVTTTTSSKKDRHRSTSQQQRRRGKLVLCRIRYHKSIDEGGCPRKRGRVEQHVSHSKRGCVGLDQQGYVDQQQPVLSVEELRGDGGDQQCDLHQQQRVPLVEERHGGSGGGGDLPQETCSLQQHSSHGGSLLSHGSGSLDVYDLIMIELVGLDQEVVADRQQSFPLVEDLDGGSCGDLLQETRCPQQDGSLRLDGSGSSDLQLPEDSVDPPQGRLVRPPPPEDSASTQPLEFPESEPPLQEHLVFTGQQRPFDGVPTTTSLGQEQDTSIFDGLGPLGQSSTSTPHDLWTEVDCYDSVLEIESRLLHDIEDGHLPEFTVQDGFLSCVDTVKLSTQGICILD